MTKRFMDDINHQLWAVLMDTIPDRIYFKDREGRFILGNKAMLNLFGATRNEEIIGKTDLDLFRPDYAARTRVDEEEIIRTGKSILGKVEKKILPDGTTAWTSTTKIALRNDKGEIIGVCGISRDVTEDQRKKELLLGYGRQLAEKQKQLEVELSLARQIQLALLPQEYPTFPLGASPADLALRFSHYYLPIGSVGGDFFTIIPVAPHLAGILLCDVMGHGVPAALVTSIQRILADNAQYLAEDPGAYLEELNRRLHAIFSQAQSFLFVTAVYAVIDVETGVFRFANASHPPPLLLDKEKGAVPLNSNPEPVPPLGVVSDSKYPTQEAMMNEGDRLFFFTDGLRDVGTKNPIGEDDAAFYSLVTESAKGSAGAFLKTLISRIKEHPGTEFSDDICIVEVEFRHKTGL